MMSSVLTKPPPLCWMEFDLQVKKQYKLGYFFWSFHVIIFDPLIV